MEARKHWHAAQIQGSRSYQEDMFEIVPPGPAGAAMLCMLADGMGGHAAGDVAASLAIKAFKTEVLRARGGSLHSEFLKGLDEANRSISHHIKGHPETSGMGCTLLAVEISNEGVNWISVGDSLLYHYDGVSLSRLNADHSMAPQLDAAAKRGEITQDEALNSSSRNVLLSAVSGASISRVDVSRSPLMMKEDGILIAASDGLETLSKDQLLSLLEQTRHLDAEVICNALLGAVESAEQDGQDNTSVIVAKHTAELATRYDEADLPSSQDEVITRVVESR